VALANSRQYGSGAQIAPKALLDDGMIEIVVVEPQSGLSIMRQVPAFFSGTLREGPGILMRSAASMEICASTPISFHVDGEPRVGPESIALKTWRRVLRVKVSP
jgi:diacylglycerol kinase (ATP)